MKQNYTDSDIKKLLVDLAELVPEIDPNDSEWGLFLREFISARPDVQLDEAFAKEVRHRILERAETLKIKKQFVFPQWMKLSGTFVAGAAMCALAVVPLLQSPDEIQENAVEDMASTRMMAQRGGVAKKAISMDLADDQMESLVLKDAEKIPEFEIAPMMVQEMAAPVMFQSLPQAADGEMVVAAGMLNSRVGVSEIMMLDTPFEGRMRNMPPQLAWEEMPSDAEILRVAIEFFQHHNFDSLGDVTPRVDKWWENREEMDWKPEFAPDRVGVIFAIGNGLDDIRIDVETRTLRVVWMSYSQSNR